MNPLHIVILAAGLGKRMYSTLPKVLHQVGGEPMLLRVINTALELEPQQIHVIIGSNGQTIKEALPHLNVNWVEQKLQLGTGHAVLQALPHIPDLATILVLSADVPLITAQSLKSLLIKCDTRATQNPLGLIVTTMDNPFGFGRIVRDAAQKVLSITEEKDASLEQKNIKEIYSGICSANASDFKRWLPKLSNHNAQEEYYLTEIIQFAVLENCPVVTLEVFDSMEIQGVNDRLQLQLVERVFQQRKTEELMRNGTTLADAKRVDIRGNINCGMDVFIDINTVFIGENSLGDNVIIEPNCILSNVTIGKNCTIAANSIIENSTIGDNCTIGPFARLRAGTKLGNHCKIGNFVETKKAVFAEKSKANHLSYLGDVTIGSLVNIGAGTITCNYDGANKHQTVIEDGVHIGSDTQLVAPIVIGENATIGAGSTLRKNAPPGELTLTVSTQKTIYGWNRPQKMDEHDETQS